MSKVAVIAGAGPAGLTAALELLRRSDVMPMVFEADAQVGGISKTINYRGNRMDLGGHRFFSKSDWVMRWWQEILPIAADPGVQRISYQRDSRDLVLEPAASADSDAVMLVRPRLSRIFYRRRFFDYPLKLSLSTLMNIGIAESLRIGLSYGRAHFNPRASENSLEDFFVNRFGDRLYRTFFKDYTEKVWGVPCREISAEWGAQRIKGLSVGKAIAHAATTLLRGRSNSSTAQRHTETSLIERFLYPKLGPGQMWEEVARQITARGGSINLRSRLVGIQRNGWKITSVQVAGPGGVVRNVPCDHLISTMPICDLTPMLSPEDQQVADIAKTLPYRDFITVGLLVSKMSTTASQDMRSPHGTASAANGMPPDNWIYIQESDVRIGRLQIFNNWSPAMVADPSTIWLGLEYFCREGDDLWSMADDAFIAFAARELETLGLIARQDVLDGTIVRVPKAYPAYFGKYRHMGKIRTFLDKHPNLYPIGRNGMHRYNNQDHSMLAANGAVNSIIDHGLGKAELWRINAEEEYHEELATPIEASTGG